MPDHRPVAVVDLEEESGELSPIWCLSHARLGITFRMVFIPLRNAAIMS